jgi:hypothetical protein
MEIYIGILSVIVLILAIFANAQDNRIDKLELKLEQTTEELTYKLLLPQISEYAKLAGHSYYERYRSRIYFDNGKSTYGVVEPSEIEDKLAALKKAIAIACPTKCVAKKKK